jgi:hypothetical protein
MARPFRLPDQGRALALDFVENELPRYHSYFKNVAVRNDIRTARYAGDLTPELQDALPQRIQKLEPALALAENAPGQTILSTTDWFPETNAEEKVQNAMKYWEKLFTPAMQDFKKSPMLSAKHHLPMYDIRKSNSWTDIYTKFEAAQRQYTVQTGVKGTARKIWRWTAENAAEPMIRLASTVVPQSDVVTPVIGAVQIMLEAAEKSAEVRGEVLKDFNELDNILSDIENILGTYPDEESLRAQALALVVSILIAIERGIVFFTQSSCKCPLPNVARQS